MTIVKLKDIYDALDRTTEEWSNFLNIKTGEVIFLPDPDSDYVDSEDEEIWELIETSDDYLRLPDQYEIHEYQIMADFAESLDDKRDRNVLFRALNGKGAFRHFKDSLYDLGRGNEYYAYKEKALYQMAEEWCVEHNISFK